MSRQKPRIVRANEIGRRDRLPYAALSMILILLTLAAFWGVLGNDFASYDDEAYVVRNDNIKHGISPASVAWALRTTYASNWHPLTWISHMLDYRLFEMDPMGHHLTSLLMHAANVVLLFWVLGQMTGAVWRSAFVAALFAVHPVHVESVAFVAERKDVLSAFFWLLTMLAYARYVRRPGKLSYGLVIAAFGLGLMAKPMLVSLPIVLLLLDWWPLGRIERSSFAAWKPLVCEKAPLFAMSAASCVITFLAQRSTAVVSVAEYPLVGRIENAVVSYADYLVKMVWPTDLSFFYPYGKHLPLWQVAASAILLVGVTWLVFSQRRARGYVAAGWLWYLVTLLPVIGLVQVGEQAMADRYTYIPLIGVFVMITWGIADLTPRAKGGVWCMSAAACVITLALAALTCVQVGYWNNAETILRHATRVNPNNSMARYNLGVLLSEHGRYDEAFWEFSEAVRANPENAEAQNNFGLGLGERGMHAEALAHLRLAVKLNPNEANAQYNLGNALVNSKDYHGAIDHFRRALKLAPKFAEAHRGLAVAYYFVGECREAWAEVRLCLKYGGTPAEGFIDVLSRKMPEP